MSGLVLRGLAAGYRHRSVLSDVSTTVDDRGWLGIIGPNGSGKSTLIKAIAGLVRHEGAVLVDGREVSELSRRQRARTLAYSPQVPLLPPGLTVTDYVLLGRTPHLPRLGHEGAADLEVVTGVLERLDMLALADRELTTLSGGERQRAVLARALAQRASILLLDEPTTGLDLGHAQALLELIDDLRAELGTTVVMSVHDLTLAAQYADHLLLLDNGHVVTQGRPAEVLTPHTLAEHYRAHITVLQTPDGSTAVTPVRRGQDRVSDFGGE